MALLNLKTGDTIDVGDAALRIAGEVIQEPDSGFNPFQIAPRLMMNLADVDKTEPCSRGVGSPGVINSAAARTELDGYEEMVVTPSQNLNNAGTVWNRTKALGRSIERSQQFLLLSALLALLLAVAAVAVAMNHYCRSRYDLVAILRTLGAGRDATA